MRGLRYTKFLSAQILESHEGESGLAGVGMGGQNRRLWALSVLLAGLWRKALSWCSKSIGHSFGLGMCSSFALAFARPRAALGATAASG